MDSYKEETKVVGSVQDAKPDDIMNIFVENQRPVYSRDNSSADCRRKVSVGPPDASAISALVFARLIRIMHIPRMLKLKLFPGLGKQNYR